MRGLEAPAPGVLEYVNRRRNRISV
eukprot:COSAG05_NODE_11857_length_493_cov_0.832487_1_plen_24_part_10